VTACRLSCGAQGHYILSMVETTDIFISGGGIAGLTAAACFGAAGFDVICVDPAPPITERDAEGTDLRSTALLQPARTLLSQMGLWARLEAHATPLETMRIIDAGGSTGEARVTQDFKASEVSQLPFGWNFPNWLLRRELSAHLQTLENVSFRPGIATQRLVARTHEARVTLSDGASISAKLVIGADGRGSSVRQLAGISARKWHYGQKAIVFAVTHPIPHENVSTEIHKSGGPFTLVPLPDFEGRPSSAVVWMENGPKAEALCRMERGAFEQAITERSCSILGPLTLTSQLGLWPIISLRAEKLVAERIALMAEAAHVVPPIGAQGLNMSLRDLATLLELAEANRSAIGSQDMLRAYEKARVADIEMRVHGIDLLNRASQASLQPAKDIRALGLSALYAIPPARKLLMKMGLGIT
jgi:2-octaprenyl-6-methoxyphenol hydroxylase